MKENHTAGITPAANDGWKPWSESERQNFFDVIQRNRRASWQITFACVAAIVVLVVVVAVLLSPLLICVTGLAVDFVNLVTPMPDLLGAIGRRLDIVLDEKTFTVAGLVQLTALVALPGLALMACAVLVLRHALARAPLFSGGESLGRAPSTDLAEHRLSNVVEEMSIAASIPLPRVRIVPGGANASVFGRDDAHATILVGEGLLPALGRSELQGALAHLIGSVAGGDLPIGMRAALTFGLFGLMARISSCFGDRSQIPHVAKLVRALIWPTRAGVEHLIEQVADPFADVADQSPNDTKQAHSSGRADKQGGVLTWREWLMMPLVGPVVLSGFLGGLVSQFLLQPLVSWAWRKRKYMADAAAVRLTRDPDALSAMVVVLAHSNVSGLQPWASHMAIVGADARGPLAGGFVPIFPSLERRQRALVAMGATASVVLKPAWSLPLPALLLMGSLGTIAATLLCVVAVLLVPLSLALSGLFTIVPFAILHALLRAI